jgi:Archaeal phage integrase
VAANTNGVAAGSHDNHDVLNKKSGFSDVNIMFESEPRVTERGSPSLVGRGIANPHDLDFANYLKSQNKRNTRQLLCYVRKYSSILETGDASPLFLTKSVTVKRHAMEALTVYAKYLGCYEKWQQIRRQYSLHWTDGNESVQALQRFFDSNLTLDSMIEKVKEMISVIPRLYGQVVLFACITGLRPSEACESVRLICADTHRYYNTEAQTLEHFRLPSVFLRPTKKAYLSYLSTDNYQHFANLGPKTLTLKAITSACRSRKISMNMHLCRKIFASHLRHKEIEPEIVDLLQGRVSQSVLTRHYLAPSQDLKTRVLDAVAALQKEIEK